MTPKASKRGPDPLDDLDFDVYLACYLYGWRLDDVESMPMWKIRRAVEFGLRFRAIDSLNRIKAGVAADPWYGAQDRARIEQEFIETAQGTWKTEKQRADEGWRRMRRARGLE